MSSRFLSAGGAMGALMRQYDWRATPLGEPMAWPQSLRSAVSIMLNSRYPIALYWGAELALLYNDAWSPIPGGKHPWALGRPAREVWPEIWDTIGPLFEKVIVTGEGVWQEDELLPMLRHGYLEECYFNFTFSPVRGEDGSIDGIFNAVVETTDRVLSERRLRTLSRMGERANSSLTVDAACQWATDILGDNAADIPFALVYLRDGDMVRLAASSSLPAGSAAAPERLSLGGTASPWPLLAAAEAARAIVVPAPAGYDLPSNFWPEPIGEVVLVPISCAGEERPSAFLVAGANPRRRVDATYRSFFELAAGHIGTALATARAYDDERRRAQALAELDRAKTAFFSNISHEFRTPLTLMLEPLADALTAAVAPEQRERLEMAHRNALRLLRLVNALLDFSRIEAGRVEAIFRPTDLAELTADLASSFRSATEKAGLQLTVDAPPLPTPVHVDRDMWEKIVLNLVSNAFKFTHEGAIAVTLREANGEAVLTVRDTGTGIPATELPKLFDRFYRVEGARGRSFEGSGIGLALVQELVALHGGTIRVDSHEGVGSSFTVAIPIGTAHLPPDRVRPANDAALSAGRAQAFVEEALRWLPGGAELEAPL
ncbi:MAG: GAF domain-containing protein, partial [Acetobacteraceae bacterium]|nr:GAF domain-containing protein [Acetobacteraceae bacterium]